MRSCFIDSSHVGVSRRLLRSISLALYRLSIFLLLNRVFLTTVCYLQPDKSHTAKQISYLTIRFDMREE